MDSDRLTVRLAEGSEPGTTRVTFHQDATWIATFHTCGDTVGIAVMRPGHEGAETLLRQRVPQVLRAHRASRDALAALANTDPQPA